MVILVKGGGVIHPIPAHSSPILHGNLKSEGVIPQKTSNCTHCRTLLHGIFSQGGWGFSTNSSPLQPFAAHSYMAILVRGLIPQQYSECQPTHTWQISSADKSSKVLALQPIAAHSYVLIFFRGSSNSPKVLLLQPIAANSYMTILFRGGGGNSLIVLPLQPNAAHS